MTIRAFGPPGVVLLALLAGCSRPPVQLTENDLGLIRATGMPDTLVRELLSEGGKLQRLTDQTPSLGMSSAPVPAPTPLLGVTAAVPHDRADAMIDRLRKLAPSGYFVFECGLHVRFAGSTVEIGIVRNMGPYDVMRAFGTGGPNYGITTEMLIARLQAWELQYGLDIRTIDQDSIWATFQRKPDNMLGFAKEVYEFCPDVVTQGAETVVELAAIMDRNNGVYLWWD